MKFNYANKKEVQVKNPDCPGKYYEDLVPATLDIAERASLAVNGLTETLDPEYDYDLYWVVDLLAEKPIMYHSVDDHVHYKFFESLPLVRTASGSSQNLDIEKKLMEKYLRMQAEDGLFYMPIIGKPWWEKNIYGDGAGMGLDFLPKEQWGPIMLNGRVLGGLCIYALKDPSGPWKEAADKLFEGLKRLIVTEGDIAYMISSNTEPGKTFEKPYKKPLRSNAVFASWLAQGLAQYSRTFGNKEAADLAAKLTRYVMRDAKFFDEEGEFTPKQTLKADQDRHSMIFFNNSWIWNHFHSHTNAIMATLEAVQETGDSDLLKRAAESYDYAVSQGEQSLGFFPEWLTYKGGVYNGTTGPCSSEICEVADMIACALKLSLLGIDKWDDADRWIRNQFSESQFTGTGWLTDGHSKPADRKEEVLPFVGSSPPCCGTTERVAERTIGCFSGWPGANDLVEGRNWSIMHCCTGNGTRAIYYIWESIITYSQDKLKVNLLLNRASKWADINSHIPYIGRVDIKVKEDINLEVRIPEWVKPKEVKASVNGKIIKPKFDKRYALIGKVFAGDIVSLEFDIYETTRTVIVEKHKYTITTRGNDVVKIDPQGINCPLYQREHYRNGQTLWKKVKRYVPDSEIKWC